MLARLFHRGSAPIGVDIGSSGVRLLQLRTKGRGIEVQAAAKIDRRATDLDADPISPRMLESIRQRITSGEFHGLDCVMTFPDQWLSARSVRLPVMNDEETKAALTLEAAERLGYSDQSPGEVSWVRAGRVRQGDDTREEIILLGAEREPLVRLVDAIVSTGLRPIAVEPSILATARAYSRRFRRDSDQSTVRVGLDIGRKNTGVVVLRGQHVAFYKPLRASGDDLTRAVAERLDLPYDAAHDLRRQRLAAATGAAEACEESVDRAVFEAVRPILDELAKETALCLRYFSVAFTGARPVLFFTSGEEAAEPRLAEIVGEALRLEYQVGAPLEGISIDPRVRLGHARAPHSEWAGAAGLSLRGLPEHRRLILDEDGEPTPAPIADTRKSAA